MRHLLSKLIAGGLSAAVILLWWPLVFPSDNVESWMIRGIVWTASFELMLHAFMPIEEGLWRSRAARRVRDKALAASGKIVADSPRRKRGGRSFVAGIAAFVPVLLLATAPAHPLDPEPAGAQVRQVTEVKRVVRVETKRVKVPQPAAGGARTTLATATVPARSAAPAASRAPRRTPARRITSRPTSDSTVRSTPTTPPRSADPPAATTDQGASNVAQPDGSGSAPTPK